MILLDIERSPSAVGVVCRGSTALAKASPTASRPTAGTRVSEFDVIPWN